MSEIGKQIITEIRRLAAASPDFVYQRPEGVTTCLYVQSGHGGCIVGQALFNLGLIDASLEGHPDNHVTSNMLFDRLELVLDIAEQRWIRNVQSQQDHSASWGYAVRYADEKALVPA